MECAPRCSVACSETGACTAVVAQSLQANLGPYGYKRTSGHGYQGRYIRSIRSIRSIRCIRYMRYIRYIRYIRYGRVKRTSARGLASACRPAPRRGVG